MSIVVSIVQVAEVVRVGTIIVVERRKIEAVLEVEDLRILL